MRIDRNDRTCHIVYVGKTSNATIAAVRRRNILESARWCFLNFGFAKTSFEDIAKRANISRTLIYKSFSNKEDIFQAVFADWFDDRYTEAEACAAANTSKKTRLLEICDLLLLEPWTEMIGAPMAHEFFAECARLAPAAEAKHEKTIRRVMSKILGDKDAAEILALSVEGQFGDMPTAKVLQRRVEVLIDHFVR